MKKNSFLDKVAADLLTRFEGELWNQTVIVPGKRTGLALRRRLGEQKKGVILPDIITIEDFFKQHSPYILADKLTLLEELYLVFIQKNNFEPFDQFIPWGEMLLSDFDDVDKYLVNAQMLYSNLKDIKSLDQWMEYLTPEQIKLISKFWESFNSGMFKNKEQFISIWETLFPVYALFKKTLSEKSLSYSGMIERYMAENLEQLIDVNQTGKFVFVGFNALTKAEEKVFKFLDTHQLSFFYWDVSSFYYENKENKAGDFIRQNVGLIKNAMLIKSDFLSENNGPDIKITGVASEVLQAKFTAQQVQKILLEQTESNIGSSDINIGIVLHNESLLPHLLSAFSNSNLGVNITMGFPLDKTNIAQLVYEIIELHHNRKQELNRPLVYNFRNIKNIAESPIFLDHPILNLNKENKMKTSFFYPENVVGVGNIIFEKNEQKSIVSILIDFLESVTEFNCFNEDEVEEKALKTLQKFLNQINSNQNLVAQMTLPDALKRILKKLTSNVRFPFKAPENADVTILGLLETRGQTFNYLFVLNANEGLFPPSSHSSGYIPYNLKKGFGLPLPDTKSAIQEYLYYQILENTSNLNFVYNTTVGDFGSGEPSRYLYKLKSEKTFQSLSEESALAKFELKTNNYLDSWVMRTPEIEQKLNEIIEISPSAINMYMDCRLKFYYRYIVGLKEEQKAIDGIEANVFGELLHDSMEAFYIEKLGEQVDKQWIESKEKSIDLILKNQFAALYETPSNNLNLKGLELIYFGILKKYIIQILKIDKEYAPFQILGLEDKDIVYNVELQLGNKSKSIQLKGSIDRVDRKDGIMRVLDYKTGSDSNTFEYQALFERDNNKRNKAAYQVLLYSVMHSKRHLENANYWAGLFSRSEMFQNGFFPVLKEKKEIFEFTTKIQQEFEVNTNALLSEIFLSDEPFSQTEDLKKCQYCPYNIFCKR